mgnify:CR=1 FL=1
MSATTFNSTPESQGIPASQPVEYTIKKNKRKSTVPVKKPGGKKALQQSTLTSGDNERLVFKKKRRFKPGTVALQQIRRYQKTTNLLFPRASFTRVVKEITQNCFSGEYRYQKSAIDALQEAAEAYVIESFENANLAAIHGSRVTIFPKDFNLVSRINNIIK